MFVSAELLFGGFCLVDGLSLVGWVAGRLLGCCAGVGVLR